MFDAVFFLSGVNQAMDRAESTESIESRLPVQRCQEESSVDEEESSGDKEGVGGSGEMDLVWVEKRDSGQPLVVVAVWKL